MDFMEQAAMNDFVEGFRKIMDEAAERLRGVAEAESQARQHPAEWSAKEVLGHLIDSAANNHQRFVRAQFTDDLVFSGYDQDQWVRVQGYSRRSWPELIELWYAYNRHLLHIIAHIPEPVLKKPRHPHSLDRIAWRLVPADQPVTLEYLILDYLEHVKEHLGQILAESR
jgi:hypothetical protein